MDGSALFRKKPIASGRKNKNEMKLATCSLQLARKVRLCLQQALMLDAFYMIRWIIIILLNFCLNCCQRLALYLNYLFTIASTFKPNGSFSSTDENSQKNRYRSSLWLQERYTGLWQPCTQYCVKMWDDEEQNPLCNLIWRISCKQSLWWAHTSRQPGRPGRRNKKAFLDGNEMLNERASSRLDLIGILIAKKKANTHPALSQSDDQLVFVVFFRFH